MWVYLVALLGSAAPDPTDAKAAFDRMERQVLMCKTLRMHLEVNSGTGKDAFLAMKGRLLIAPGDKVRLELDGSMGGNPAKMALVSDGTKQRATSTGSPAQDQDTKKGLGKLALTSVSRCGVVPTFILIATQDPAEKEAFAISGLKLGKKEPVSGVESQVIEHQITLKNLEQPISVTVWVDVKTNLPVKRVVTLKEEGRDTIIVTETYTKAVVDGKLDEKEFALPK
jgi:hypothetical protein